jgi:hypothetical protein
MTAAAPTAPPPPPARPWLPLPIALAGLSGLPVLAAALATAFAGGEPALPDVFLNEQDAAPLVAATVWLVLLAVLRSPAVPSRWRASERALPIAAAAAALTGLVGWIGARLVFGGVTISADETMARFDAAILAHGHLLAPVAPAWRPLEPALAPSFLLMTEGWTHWASNYLPVNSALQALAAAAGDASLASALLAGAAVLAAYGCARRLWPDRPLRAWTAAVLLASSPQVLVTAMTPYAMTAHLAFDLAWLWLVLDRRWASQVAAGLVGFLACGLHQVVFHPMFAAPFVLNMLCARRWAQGGFHVAVYALAGLFWTGWFAMAAHAEGATLSPHHGSVLFTLGKLLEHFDPGGIFRMAENLARFAAWQNPLLCPLWLWAAAQAFRRDARGVERALAAAPVLAVTVVTVLLPYQGHGWGYRYLHGPLGAMALTGAAGWDRLLERRDDFAREGAWRGWTACLGVALLVVAPLHAAQACAWAQPFAASLRRIRTADADVVLVDSRGLFFAWDLVRNDPFLAGRPKMLALELVRPDDLARLCATQRVAVFDRTTAARTGFRAWPWPMALEAQAEERRAWMRSIGCGRTL